jgi:hypothetical protein
METRIVLPVGTIIAPGFVVAFRRLCQVPLPARTSYGLKRTHDQIVAYIKRNGAEHAEFRRTEVELLLNHRIKLSDLGDFKISAAELEELGPLLDYNG